jgi:hypothetical protein
MVGKLNATFTSLQVFRLFVSPKRSGFRDVETQAISMVNKKCVVGGYGQKRAGGIKRAMCLCVVSVRCLSYAQGSPQG